MLGKEHACKGYGPSEIESRYLPFVTDLHVELFDLLRDFTAARRLIVDSKSRALAVGCEIPADDDIGPAFGAFEFELDVALLSGVLDEVMYVIRTAEGLRGPKGEMELRGE